jgi:putative Mn2+ efflux pump MntP
VLRLIALVLPLGLDTFAVSAALGIAGLPPDRRLRVSAVFTAFEVVMPLVGVIAGVTAGRLLGGVAEYLALGGLATVGIYMFLETDPDAAILTRSRGAALLGLGLSLSIDELAIGFSLGLLGVPMMAAVALIGVQAFVLSQVGLRLGDRVGARFREGAERLAAAGLIALAAGLLLLRLTGRSL